MHSPSPQMVKESKNLCQPSGASSRSGATGPVFSHCVQLERHRREELPLVHSISQMVTIRAAPGVSWRPDLNCRHSLTDGVNNLPGNTLGFFRTGASLIKSGVEIRKRLVFRGGRLAGRSWRPGGLPPTWFRRCHVVMVAEATKAAKQRMHVDYAQFPVNRGDDSQKT